MTTIFKVEFNKEVCLSILIISMTHVQLKRIPFGYLFTTKGTQREGRTLIVSLITLRMK